MHYTANCLFGLVLALLGTACIGAEDEGTEPELIDDAAVESVESSEQALVTCSGNGCDGQDPGSTGCGADGLTAQKLDIFGFNNVKLGTVALRYSPTCKTFWSHVVPIYSNNTTGADVSRTDGAFASSGLSTGNSKSPMLFAPCYSGKFVRGGGQIDPPGSSYGSATTAFYCVP
ncbi:MAG: DUF2690 domain-containing protein [Polyangiaceae bacterium]|nr:DUF2690 domain-containing protein [Polyangiaceae bacterium]